MEPNSKTIGRNIAQIRKALGKKASDIAGQLNMKEAAYTKHERGETALTVEFIYQVAVALNVNYLVLITADPDDILDSLRRNSIVININDAGQANTPQYR